MDGAETTTPTGQRPHGIPPRGLEGTSSSPVSTGRFGRMFRNLPVYPPQDSSLAELGRAMIQELEGDALDEPLGEADEDENTATLGDGRLRLPAGYTYFGQFVDHDITFDPVSSLSRQNDPDGLEDFRTPRFDLDSLYGRGPADQPYLYEKGVRLLLGEDVGGGNAAIGGPDLQRTANGVALIGDPRNDENLIVSQLQATFVKFHNRVLDRFAEQNPHLKDAPEDLFKLTQKEVRWHYQWVVVHDFLPRLVGEDVVDDILRPEPYLTPTGDQMSPPVPKLRFYDWNEKPFMPVEFSVAAYRFGHSMIRPSYEINEVATLDPAIPDVTVNRIPIFPIAGQDGEKQSLKGFRKLVAQWGVQWRFFLDGIEDGAGDDPNLPQPSYKLDAELANPLRKLPSPPAEEEDIGTGDKADALDLAVRNLIRGKRLGLPSGQDVARAMGIPPLSDEELFAGIALSETARNDLTGRAPLWYYILKEAEVKAEGAHLGPVGGRIVAEVLIGLLAGDPLSYLRVAPEWKPSLGPNEGSFSLSDLVNVAIPAPQAEVPAPYPG